MYSALEIITRHHILCAKDTFANIQQGTLSLSPSLFLPLYVEASPSFSGLMAILGTKYL